MPCVQGSLCLNEVTNDFGSTKVEGRTRDMFERCMATSGKAAGARAKMRSRARKKKHQLRKYEAAEAKRFESKSWVDVEVFDLIDMRKVKPKSYVTGRWVLTIKTDKQGNFLKAKAT